MRKAGRSATSWKEAQRAARIQETHFPDETEVVVAVVSAGRAIPVQAPRPPRPARAPIGSSPRTFLNECDTLIAPAILTYARS